DKCMSYHLLLQNCCRQGIGKEPPGWCPAAPFFSFFPDVPCVFSRHPRPCNVHQPINHFLQQLWRERDALFRRPPLPCVHIKIVRTDVHPFVPAVLGFADHDFFRIAFPNFPYHPTSSFLCLAPHSSSNTS